MKKRLNLSADQRDVECRIVKVTEEFLFVMWTDEHRGVPYNRVAMIPKERWG